MSVCCDVCVTGNSATPSSGSLPNKSCASAFTFSYLRSVFSPTAFDHLATENPMSASVSPCGRRERRKLLIVLPIARPRYICLRDMMAIAAGGRGRAGGSVGNSFKSALMSGVFYDRYSAPPPPPPAPAPLLAVGWCLLAGRRRDCLEREYPR